MPRQDLIRIMGGPTADRMLTLLELYELGFDVDFQQLAVGDGETLGGNLAKTRDNSIGGFLGDNGILVAPPHVQEATVLRKTTTVDGFQTAVGFPSPSFYFSDTENSDPAGVTSVLMADAPAVFFEIGDRVYVRGYDEEVPFCGYGLVTAVGDEGENFTVEWDRPLGAFLSDAGFYVVVRARRSGDVDPLLTGAKASGVRTIASATAAEASGFQTKASEMFARSDGAETIASGEYSYAGGAGSIASAGMARATGSSGRASRFTQKSHGFGNNFQDSHYGVTTNTTNATPLVFQVLNLESKHLYDCTISVVAWCESTNDVKCFARRAVAKRGADGTAALVGTVQTITPDIADAGASAWAISIAVNNTSKFLEVTLTGMVGPFIRWAVGVDFKERWIG